MRKINNVNFKRSEGKGLENSNTMAIEEPEYEQGLEICEPYNDFLNPIVPFKKSDGVVFESEEMDYIY